ncbi:hypothetical protein Zmor_008435 [Zophobas morio]|uniref:CRAL-TRIO domain-containing protein n=1 Tax=Zophobas morio TaxID=2755281 RepID=A0AA38MQC4_9CUCU|nr:hypothetical protein Zmor_008435 [Zophobas morio]
MSFKLIEAEKLYEKDPQLQKQDIEVLHQWLNGQPHLPKLMDIQIAFFLHHCYHDLEQAKTTIDHYCTLRNLCPEAFTALTPDVLKTTASIIFVNILPKTTPEGYIILVNKVLDERVNNFNCGNFVNLINMVATLYIHQNSFLNGVIVLFDMNGVSFGHLLKLSIRILRHALRHLQKSAPFRIMGIHVMNALPLTNKIIALLKPFLSNELYNSIYCHPSNSDTLYKFVPKECLPEDFGGELPSIKVLNEKSLQNLLDNYEFYEWHDSQKVDESKRPVKRK